MRKFGLLVIALFGLKATLFALDAPSDLELIPHRYSVTLKWQDNSDDEIGYKIYRNGELIAILPQDSTFFVDSALTPNTTYSYTIKATDDEIDRLDRRLDFFPIGAYFIRGQKPIVDDGSALNIDEDFRHNPDVAAIEYGREFADLKRYNFNTAILKIDPLALIENGKGEDVIDVILQKAKENSLKLILPLGHIQEMIASEGSSADNVSDDDIDQALREDFIEKFALSDAVLGYEIYDEPSPNDIDLALIAKIKDRIFNEFDSKAFGLTSWNDINSWGELRDIIDPEVVMSLSYPFAVDAYNGDQANGDTPYGDLSDAIPRGDEGTFNDGNDVLSVVEWTNYAYDIAQHRPLWAIIQAFGGDTYWRDPIAKEIRLQAFTAVVSGAKGLFYFLYQSEDWIRGMMDINYQPTPLITEAKEVNKKLKALAPILLKLKKSVTNYASTSNNATVQTFEGLNLAIGADEKYIAVVNNNIFASQTITINIDESWLSGQTIATDKYSGKRYELDDNKITLQVDAADGVLLFVE